ncbi:MAG: hypothetical protein HYS32_02970 [Candidatus Woesearchaeota archaeon]|nr:MAG: hypothetical protein HYS32_02970 [Candidatus Woesearchaeota archaeon]
MPDLRPARVIVAQDGDFSLALMQRIAREEWPNSPNRVTYTIDSNRVLELVTAEGVDLVISGQGFSGVLERGTKLFRRIKERRPETAIVRYSSLEDPDQNLLGHIPKPKIPAQVAVRLATVADLRELLTNRGRLKERFPEITWYF